jgi:hypothetical protein
MAAILFLTVDSIFNHVYWNEWRGGDKRIRFYVNAKDPLFKTPEGFLRLPPDLEFRETAWGHHSLVLAHQALLTHALADFKEAEWFVLVSGDALPLRSTRELFQRLKPGQSMFDEFNDDCLYKQWAVMNEALQQCNMPNWWADVAADRGKDEEGFFRVLSESVCAGVSQFHILCREHAQDIANMPRCVPEDFDKLLNIVGGTDVSFAADEVVTLGYLNYLGKGKDIVRTANVMHAPGDPKNPAHARALRSPVLANHVFGRKYHVVFSFKKYAWMYK